MWASRHYRRAMKLLDKDDLEGCAAELDAAVAKAPANPRWYIARASFYAGHGGDLDRAAEDLRRAAQLNPRDSEIYMRLAEVYRDLGMEEEQIETIDLAVRTAEANNAATALHYLQRAGTYQDHDRYEQAREDFERALIIAEPHLVDAIEKAMTTLARLEREARMQKAIDGLALDLYLPDGQSTVSAIEVGAALRSLGHPVELDAIEAFGSSEVAAGWRFKVKLSAAEPAEVLVRIVGDSSGATAGGPVYARHHAELTREAQREAQWREVIESMLCEGDAEGALALLNDMIRIQSNSSLAAARARLRRLLGDEQRAIVDAMYACDLGPSDPLAQIEWVRKNLSGGYLDRIEQSVRLAVSLAPESADVALVEAEYHLACSDVAAARAAMTRAWENLRRDESHANRIEVVTRQLQAGLRHSDLYLERAILCVLAENRDQGRSDLASAKEAAKNNLRWQFCDFLLTEYP